MAAVLATGHTRIENAAREPEIVDIAELLVAMGAQHRAAPAPRRIEIDGVDALSRDGVTTSSPTGSSPARWAFAAATTRGDVEVVGGRAEHLDDRAGHAGRRRGRR